MKNILPLLIVFTSLSLEAQQIFTVGEVYNFQIGDEFGYQDFASGYSYSTTTLKLQKVLSRQDSTNALGDTVSIIYQFMVQEKFTNSVSPSSNYDTSYQYTETVIHLTDSVIAPCDPLNCYYNINNDTFTLMAGCTFLSCTQWPTNTTCTDSRTFYVKNLGMVKTGNCTGSYPDFFVTGSNLVYYKHGNTTCGTAPLTFTGFETPTETANGIFVYPNPATNQLNITGIAPKTELIITNLGGEILYKTTVQNKTETIDIATLPAGMYFLNKQKFIKE